MPGAWARSILPGIAMFSAALVAPVAGPAVAAAISFHPADFRSLPGWSQDRHAAAFGAFRRSCEKLQRQPASRTMGPLHGTVGEWRPVCRVALSLARPLSDAKARGFFERYFVPFAIRGSRGDRGLFTGYFEPELEGSLKPSRSYPVPVYPVPKDLVAFSSSIRRHASARNLPRGRVVNGVGYPYFSREEIDKGALAGRVKPLLYLSDKVDAFFLHVQGSGRVRLPDGSVRRIGFAAKTGLPYTSIGAVLGKSGALPHGGISMQTIKQWLYDNPDKADEVLWANRSYIFFRLLETADPNLGPPGAAGVPLTPARSLAVDRKLHGYGTPLWLDTTAPVPETGAEVSFRRLMIAQDTGTAIIGAVRGDVFWGAGDRAGAIAGLMKSRGRMYALIPVAVAKRLLRK